MRELSLQQISLRVGVRRVVAILLILGTLAIGAALVSNKLISDEWRKRSISFVEQVNSLGRTLEPGGVSTIHINGLEIDELIYLPAYCDIEELSRYFHGRPASFVNELFSMSGNDHICPALVWLRHGRVLSANPARFSVSVKRALRSWKVRGRREILVKKELQSKNTFLSLIFLEDKDTP